MREREREREKETRGEYESAKKYIQGVNLLHLALTSISQNMCSSVPLYNTILTFKLIIYYNLIKLMLNLLTIISFFKLTQS